MPWASIDDRKISIYVLFCVCVCVVENYDTNHKIDWQVEIFYDISDVELESLLLLNYESNYKGLTYSTHCSEKKGKYLWHQRAQKGIQLATKGLDSEYMPDPLALVFP